MTTVAIIGGGPGGLLAAYFLAQKCPLDCDITVFEASGRLGGKVLSRRFTQASVPYEAGVAELYDYSALGPDPLRQLLKTLGLKTRPMRGQTVVLGTHILRHRADIKKYCGDGTLKAIEAFRRQAAAWLSPMDYYEGYWRGDNAHPLAQRSCQSLLEEVKDEAARRYLQIAAHSDIATEPHLTNALNGLKNFLMDVPGYIRLYTIEGGLERFSTALSEHIQARIELNSPVTRIEKSLDDRYRVWTRRDGKQTAQEFDFTIVVLPHNWLSFIEWSGEQLAQAMRDHYAFYDHPAHYLRVSLLFHQPFWRGCIKGDYFLLDAFGGCCVYDESARQESGGYGVLGWLLAGNDAVTLSNLCEEELIARMLDTLPPQLAHGREFFIEGRVHRWLNSVNGLPGGWPVKEPRARHRLEPQGHPGLFVAGDYLFDSTINGVMDSVDIVTDLALTEIRRRKYQEAISASLDFHGTGSQPEVAQANRDQMAALAGLSNRVSGCLNTAYHDFYDGERPYEESFEEYFDAEYTAELIEIVWGAQPPYRLLDSGSANGLTLEAFAELGIDAWGVENSEHIYNRTRPEWKHRNVLGDVRSLPFEDGFFDFVYDTCLCYVPPVDVEQAIRELYRVVKVGVFWGGITTDMRQEVIDKHDIFYGVQTLGTLWEWAELFLRNGFRLAIKDQKTLTRAWRCEVKANEGDATWYPNRDAMRYCFFSRVPVYPTLKA